MRHISSRLRLYVMWFSGSAGQPGRKCAKMLMVGRSNQNSIHGNFWLTRS